MEKVVDKKRRMVIIGGAAGMASLVVLYFVPRFVSTGAKSDPNRLKLFADLSRVLTNKDVSAELVEFYYQKLLQDNVKQEFINLLDRISIDMDRGEDLRAIIDKQIKRSESRKIVTIITKMWYKGELNGKTLSIAAYQQSLVWPLFGSTPPGICAGNAWQNEAVFSL